MTEQENNLGAKTEVTGKQETISLPSDIKEDESEELKENAMEEKNKMGAKNEEESKTETGFSQSDQDWEESEALKEAVTEQEMN